MMNDKCRLQDKIAALEVFVAADDALVTAEDYRMAGVMTQDEYDRIASRKREARNKLRKVIR
jgi:hypothetical protein